MEASSHPTKESAQFPPSAYAPEPQVGKCCPRDGVPYRLNAQEVLAGLTPCDRPSFLPPPPALNSPRLFWNKFPEGLPGSGSPWSTRHTGTSGPGTVSPLSLPTALLSTEPGPSSLPKPSFSLPPSFSISPSVTGRKWPLKIPCPNPWNL